MLVSRKFENTIPVPPTMHRPSETNKRVRAGRAGYLRVRGGVRLREKYTQNIPIQDWASVR